MNLSFCLILIIFLIPHTLASKPLTLLRGGNVYSPKHVGKRDILVGGTKILKIASKIDIDPSIAHIIDVDGKIVIPGLIDVHMHVTGGGGELGPSSRTPEAKLHEIIAGGITTLVGVLGTDGVSRSLENLYVKLRALEQDGLTTMMWSGNYRIPSKTLTGSIQSDLVLIDKVIGFKGAVSDHRSAQPSQNELEKMISDCRVGGLISGKAGKAYFHMGDATTKLDPLFRIIDTTPIPIKQIYITHTERNPSLIEEAKKWIKRGGVADFTASTEAERAIMIYKRENVSMSKVTMSSDSYGSMPVFNERGNVIRYSYVKPESLFQSLKKLSIDHKLGWEESLALSSSNVADILQIVKGKLKEGFDADLVILDRNHAIEWVFSRGEMLKNSTWIKKSMFD